MTQMLPVRYQKTQGGVVMVVVGVGDECRSRLIENSINKNTRQKEMTNTSRSMAASPQP